MDCDDKLDEYARSKLGTFLYQIITKSSSVINELQQTRLIINENHL